jgi:tryptophan-rich sensory protein
VTAPFAWMALTLWGVIAVLGLAIAFHAFRARRGDKSRSLTLLGVGFLLISVAAGFLWVGIFFAIHDPMVSGIAATAAMAAGFATVLVSVRVRVG